MKKDRMKSIINTIASLSLAVAGFGLAGCESLGLGKSSTPVTKASETSSDPTGGFSDAGIRERAGISRNYAISGMKDTTVGATRPTTMVGTEADTLSHPPKPTTTEPSATEPSDVPDTKPAEQEPVVTPEPDKTKPDDAVPAKPDDVKPEMPAKPEDVKPDAPPAVKPEDAPPAPPAADPAPAPEPPAAPAADEPAKKPDDAPAPTPPPAEENK